MPKMLGYKLTKAGNRLQIKVEAGKCKLNVTKLQTGSGSAEGDITDLTALVSPEQTVPVNKVNIINQYTARFTAIITNQGLTKDYYLREIGLFAQDPDDGEILYMIGIDEKPDVIPADGYQMLISQEFNIDVVISNVENITVNGKYANLITTEDLNTHNTATDAHANLFKKVLLTEAKTIANTADWNTLTESRTYKISGVTFAADKHQPVGAVGTGELVVLKNGNDTIAQVYYANSAAYDKAGAYHRMCIGGAWTDWVYNITNKGGVVTGDFNINGKLTVDSIEVSDSLTVGGTKPLGKDAIDKLQAQIITPTQNIFVDQKKGNDNNDGTTKDKAVETIDKALTLIKPYTNIVVINLQTYAESENLIYNTFSISKPLDISNKYHVNTFALTGDWEPYKTDNINAKIIVPYGKKQTGMYDYSTGVALEKCVWGNFLFVSGNNVQLNQVIPVFPDSIETDASKYMNTVFSGITGSARIYEGYNNTIQLSSANTSILNGYLGSSFDNLFFYLQNIQGTGFLTKWGYPALYINDPKKNPEETKYPGTSGSNQQYIINKIISSGTTINPTILGDTKGIDTNISVIYSNL